MRVRVADGTVVSNMGEKKKKKKKSEEGFEPEDAGPPIREVPKDPTLYDYEPIVRDVIREKQAI